MTDPQLNQTTYKFQGNYETSRLVRDSHNNLLATVLTCYNGAAAPCDTTAVGLPITRRTVTTQMPNSAGRQSKTDTFLNIYGVPTEVDTYDWATGAVGPLIQKVLTSYASLGNHISDRPQIQTVQDGGTHTLAQSTYTYDEGSVTGTIGTPQHVAITGARGNPTTVARLVGGTATLSTHYAYYDTGTINTITDPNTAVTTYNYSPTGSCGNSFVTSVSLPLGLSQASTWDCNGGVVTQVTDANNQTVNYQYTDPFWRTTQVPDQANVPTSIAYSKNSVESLVVFNGGNSTVDMLATLDSQGRSHIAQKKQSVNVGANYDSVETDYDSLGRPYRVTMPYAAAAGVTNATAPATITAYDTLSRPTQVTDGGNGTVTVSYSGNDVKRTTGPAPTVSRQLEYDALGRLTSVCELTGASDKVACGQYAAANGYFTQYAYDTAMFNGNLVTRLTVTQNALSANSQTRTFLYDLLGRLLSETNPEWGPGTTTNVYDSDTTCTGGYPTGDLLKRTDAMGNVTCYTYDQLHRLTDLTYFSGPYAPATPAKHFVYDNATVNGVAMALAKGRLAEAYTGTSGSKVTDLGFSYSTRGEVTDIYQSSLNSGGYYHLNATYWEHGPVKKLMGVSPSSLTGYSATYGVEGAGRPYSVTAASGQNPVTSVTYNNGAQTTQPIGALTGVALGSGDSDTFSFDASTGRFNKYTFTVNSQSVVGTLTWNTNGSLGSLQITDPFNSADSQTCNYGYDDLGRAASANCGTAWNQTYSYDPFGNVKKTAAVGTSFIPTYNLATNRYSSISGCTPPLAYDGNGNLQSDCTNAYAWDAEGKPATINTISITYDAFGRAVESHGASYTQIVYGPQGNKIALMSGQNLTKSFVPLPAGGTAVYTSTGLAYYRHSDWLGSSRFASTPTAPTAKYFDVAYAPYGEDYANSGTRDVSFTGENQDLASGLYDFLYRKYNPVHGRWMSPDPLGMAAVNPANPQSWNRYAYVGNGPLTLTDPLGLDYNFPPDLIDTSIAIGTFATAPGTRQGCAVDGMVQAAALGCTFADILARSGAAVITCAGCQTRQDPESGVWEQIVGWQWRTALTLDDDKVDVLAPVWQDIADPTVAANNQFQLIPSHKPTKTSPYIVPGTQCSAGCHPEPPVHGKDPLSNCQKVGIMLYAGGWLAGPWVEGPAAYIIYGLSNAGGTYTTFFCD